MCSTVRHLPQVLPYLVCVSKREACGMLARTPPRATPTRDGQGREADGECTNRSAPPAHVAPSQLVGRQGMCGHLHSSIVPNIHHSRHAHTAAQQPPVLCSRPLVHPRTRHTGPKSPLAWRYAAVEQTTLSVRTACLLLLPLAEAPHLHVSSQW